MCKIVLSIHEEFVNKILSGEKRYEFRTRVASRKVDKIVIYCTYPVMKVVGEVEVTGLVKGNPDSVWKKTKNYSGIRKDYFDEYFRDRDNAFAYELGSVIKYNKYKELSDIGLKTAPQSFIYLD